ncbi:MAG TPA: monovalent cation/H(+) antiporter subunit G [Actinomycetota bacterium]|nr:monovalent cation/H(+) antiporter subunit G [Actinomycetota bacterium]
MSPRGVAVALLIGTGTFVAVVCSLGLLVLPDIFDRLHFLSGLTVATLLVTTGVVVRTGWHAISASAAIVAAGALVAGPTLTHAVGRTARFRDHGTLEIDDGERSGPP